VCPKSFREPLHSCCLLLKRKQTGTLSTRESSSFGCSHAVRGRLRRSSRRLRRYDIGIDLREGKGAQHSRPQHGREGQRFPRAPAFLLRRVHVHLFSTTFTCPASCTTTPAVLRLDNPGGPDSPRWARAGQERVLSSHGIVTAGAGPCPLPVLTFTCCCCARFTCPADCTTTPAVLRSDNPRGPNARTPHHHPRRPALG